LVELSWKNRSFFWDLYPTAVYFLLLLAGFLEFALVIYIATCALHSSKLSFVYRMFVALTYSIVYLHRPCTRHYVPHPCPRIILLFVHALVTMFLVHVLVYRPCTRHYVPRPCTRIRCAHRIRVPTSNHVYLMCGT
jgi:hypothetical protein